MKTPRASFSFQVSLPVSERRSARRATAVPSSVVMGVCFLQPHNVLPISDARRMMVRIFFFMSVFGLGDYKGKMMRNPIVGSQVSGVFMSLWAAQHFSAISP